MITAVTSIAAKPVSLRDLFVEHGAYVGSSLRRLGVPFDDIEDVLHEVFLQVHKRLDEYDPSRPPRPWLFAFAFRVAALHRRRAQRSRELPRPGLEPVDPAPRADERIAAAEERELVLAALEAIPFERRAVFVLCDVDAVSAREVGEALSIPMNTVYSRLRVAREEFAAAVKRLRLRRGDE